MGAGCLDNERATAFVANLLDAVELHAAIEHLESCDHCQALIATLIKMNDGRPLDEGARPPILPGTTIDRYEVLEWVGSGGMGTVYMAADRGRDRKVALKVIHAHWGSERARKMVRREAEALARLQHENVLTVHEVLFDGDRTVLVLEYVEGLTLRAWSREAPRSQQAIVAVLKQVALAMAAAHDVGVIHRDIKPENILVTGSGRAVVTDFGLARWWTASAGGASSEPHLWDPGADTTTTTFGGTPAYMAPELRSGAPSTPASDQFSFCMVAWEALSGTRIAPDEAAATARWRSHIGRVFARGLAHSPEQRHKSMRALIRTLDRVHHRRRRLLAVVGLVSLSLAGIAAGYAWQRSDDGSTCSPSTRQQPLFPPRLRERLVSGESLAGLDARTEIVAMLDRYAATWSAHREQICRALADAAEHPDRSPKAGLPPELALQLGCVEQTKADFLRLVQSLADLEHLEPGQIEAAIASLNHPDHCDARRPIDANDSPSHVAAELTSLRRRIEASVDNRNLEPGLGLIEARQAEHEAQRLGYEPLILYAEMAVAYHLAEDEESRSRRLFERAFDRGEQLGLARLCARGAVLGATRAWRRRDHDRAHELLLAAERRFAAEVVDPIWEAKVHDLRGTMLMSSGSVEQAQESFLRAYELLELAHAASVAAANDIAEIYATRGRFDEGLAWIDGVYDSLSIAHEDDPFELAPLWRTRGALLHEIGEYERSFAAFERSRELVEGRETDLARTFLLASLLGMIGALEAAHHPFLIMPLVDRCVDVATAQRDARSLVSCEWTCARILAQFERGEEAERALLRAYEHLVESRSEDELVQTWRIDDLVAFAADLDRFGQRSRARRLARVARRAAAERPELAPLPPSSVAELERLLGP